MTTRLRLLLPVLAALGAACEREAPPASAAPPPAAGLPTRPVLAQALSRCEADVAALAQPAPEVPDEVDARVDGLLQTLLGTRGDLRTVALEELAQLGDGVVPALAARLRDREREASLRGAAAEALGAIDTPAAAEALLSVLESSRGAPEPEPWLYAQCAWHLGKTSQDWATLRMVLCLKYEEDHPTVVWLADSLARFGLLSGLEALFVVARDGDETARAEAEGVLERLRAELGCADWLELDRLWLEGNVERLPPAPASPRYRLEVWRTIAALAEWQLRGVDDARFVLSHLRPEDAARLGQALSDDNVYVRLHSAQCLERMGPRGLPASPALIERLDDPQVGPQAAAALGSVGFAPAADALLARLDAGHPLELRVAAARALGRLGSEGLADALLPLVRSDAPIDLRAAAAQALVEADAPAPALAPSVQLLAGLLTSGEVEPRAPEDALGAWLARRAEADDAVARSVLEEWLAVPTEPETARHARRAALILERASALGL